LKRRGRGGARELKARAAALERGPSKIGVEGLPMPADTQPTPEL
jgi:hypothetical protein